MGEEAEELLAVLEGGEVEIPRVPTAEEQLQRLVPEEVVARQDRHHVCQEHFAVVQEKVLNLGEVRQWL